MGSEKAIIEDNRRRLDVHPTVRTRTFKGVVKSFEKQFFRIADVAVKQQREIRKLRNELLNVKEVLDEHMGTLDAHDAPLITSTVWKPKDHKVRKGGA